MMKHKTIISIIILLGLFVLSCNQEKKNSDKSNEYFFELVQIKPDNNIKDLMFLNDIIENPKYIGLGEVTHGSKEIFDFKIRLVQFFVKEKGSRMIFIEANMPDCYEINKYICTGTGIPEKLIDDLGIPVMNTQEYVDLIVWLKEYNSNKSDNNKVKLYGYDMQNPQGAIMFTLNYLKSNSLSPDSELINECTKLINSGNSVHNVRPDDVEIFLNTTIQLEQHFDSNKSILIKNSNQEDFDFNKAILTSAKQSFQLLQFDRMEDAYYTRDKYAYENILRLSKGKTNTPVLIWAHNGHIIKKDLLSDEFVTLGNHFAINFEDDYFAIGSAFYNGDVYAINNQAEPIYEEIHLPEPDSTSAEYFFVNQEYENFFLDIESALEDNKWQKILTEPTTIRSIGAAYEPNTPGRNYRPTIFCKQYDAIFFIKESSIPEPNKF